MSRRASPIVEAVLDRSEAAEFARVLDTSTLDRSRAGSRHLTNHPAVSAVAADPRMLGLARQFLGESAIPSKATLFDKSPVRNWLVAWHQDTALPVRERREVPEWGPWSIKAGVTYAHAPASALAEVVALRLPLDDSRPDNGPLRVLPGTHALGLLTESDIARLTTEIAYVSNEGGQTDVYVQSFPGPGAKSQVSRDGGTHPVWRADGRELFYLAADGMMMAVTVGAGRSFDAGRPQALFSSNAWRRTANQVYAVTKDGQRFLVNATPQQSSGTAPLKVVLNWTAALRR